MELVLALVRLDERCVIAWPRDPMWRAQAVFPNALVRDDAASASAAGAPMA